MVTLPLIEKRREGVISHLFVEPLAFSRVMCEHDSSDKCQSQSHMGPTTQPVFEIRVPLSNSVHLHACAPLFLTQ